MAITKVINDAVDLNQTTDYSGLRLPVGTTGNVVESFTTDYLVVGGGGGGGGRRDTGSAGGGAGGLRTSYNNSTTTTNTLSFPSGKTAIATYMLDNNATDVSENYDGAETNITYNTGQYGGAAVFNGSSSYIDVSSLTSLFGGKNTNTVSLWFKSTATTYADFFNDYAQSSINNIIGLNADGTVHAISRYNSVSSYIQTTGTYNDGNWHHIVSVVDIGNLTKTLYIDGSQIGSPVSISSNAWNGASNQKVSIGAEYSTSTSSYRNYFNGSIDQVRIYDTALSSTDVTNIYNNEVQANSGGGTAAESSLTLNAGTSYDVTVGAGGIDTYTSGGSSGSGANSIFSTITSTGGGGAGATSGGAGAASGKNGGSGGGAGSNTGGSPGSGTLGQGYIGGTALFYGGSYAGGGGGGALGSGGNTTSNTVAGNGGAQLNLAITGNSVGYAGGGGGSLYGTGTVGTNDSSAGAAAPSGSSSANGESAPFNLGGGGGGANHIAGITNITGGAGGSGVVILRYPTASVSGFTTTGTLNTPSTTDTIADTAYPVANTAYYKLDNSAIDLSGSTGKFDQGGVFNGSSSYIDAGNINLGTNNVSVSLWVHPNSSQVAYANIIDYNHSSAGGWTIQQDNTSTNSYKVTVYNGSTYNISSAFSLTANQWSNVVFTITSAGVYNIYVNNGTPTTGTGLTGLSASTNNTLNIGRWIGGTSRYWGGSIDQVRLYNVALSSDDVIALYGETVSTTGQLNFPSGQTAIATYELNGNANGILTTTDLSTVNYPAGAGCIALYEMNGTADDTSGAYNGTPSNIDYNFGAFGQAAVFNGSSSYIDVSSLIYLFDSKATATVSLWFNTSTTATTSVLFSDYASSTARNFLVSINSTGNIVWNTRYGSGAGRDSNITTTSTYNDGSWHYIVLSIDQAANAKSMYVDGSQIGSSIALPTATGASFDSTQRVTMGSSYNTGTAAYQDYYNGKIDQVRIFNTALTQAQVTTLARGIGTSYSGADTNVSYAYNGTPTNVTYGNGRFNEAANFNGSSSKIVLPNSSLGITDASNFSFSCWFNTNSSTQDNQGIIWTNGSNAGARFGVGINSTSQGGDTSVYFGVGTSSFTYINSGTSAFTANTWVHVVCVKSSTTGMSLYVNNVLKATNTGATGAASSTATGDNRIGGYKTSAESSWFNGSIDQVRIYGAALTSSQVTDLYNEHYQTKFTDGSDTAIVFTEGTGTVTFSGVDPAPPQGALRANTSYSEDGSASVIEHYNGTGWKYFDAIKYCTTNTLNFPSGAGCIASYNFNNNVDDIGNTYNGVNSNVTFNASGKFGAAAVFNGSSSGINLPSSLNTSVIDATGAFSISMWINANDLSTIQYLFAAGIANNIDLGINTNNLGTGKIVWTIYNTSYSYLISTTTITTNTWYNIIVTYNNGLRELFINGASQGTATKTLVENSTAPTLGYRNTGGSVYFNGEIDQVRIFNDSLTSDEVAQLYNNEIACS